MVKRSLYTHTFGLVVFVLILVSSVLACTLASWDALAQRDRVLALEHTVFRVNEALQLFHAGPRARQQAHRHLVHSRAPHPGAPQAPLDAAVQAYYERAVAYVDTLTTYDAAGMGLTEALGTDRRAAIRQLRAARRATERRAATYQRLALAVMVFGALVGLLLALWAARSIIQPIRQLHRHARRIATGDTPDTPLYIESNYTEIRELADALDGVAAHVRERGENEQSLRLAKEEAEEMNRLKSAFLSNISHEIRTPLTAIIGFADLLVDEVPPQLTEMVRLIRRSGERLLLTLNSVLDLSKLEAGTLQPERHPLDLCAELAEKALLLRPLAQEKGLDLYPVLPPTPVWAALDDGALERILNNLIGNAIKFTETGAVCLELSTGDGQAHIRVRDTGVGIGEGFLPHLFKPFRQESSGVDRTHNGAGLGLAITRRLVELMQGHIAVESEKGVGTVITVSFPLLAAGGDGAPPATEPFLAPVYPTTSA